MTRGEGEGLGGDMLWSELFARDRKDDSRAVVAGVISTAAASPPGRTSLTLVSSGMVMGVGLLSLPGHFAGDLLLGVRLGERGGENTGDAGLVGMRLSSPAGDVGEVSERIEAP